MTLPEIAGVEFVTRMERSRDFIQRHATARDPFVQVMFGYPDQAPHAKGWELSLTHKFVKTGLRYTENRCGFIWQEDFHGPHSPFKRVVAVVRILLCRLHICNMHSRGSFSNCSRLARVIYANRIIPEYCSVGQVPGVAKQSRFPLLGSRLRQGRKRRRLTQLLAAKSCGVSLSVWSNWERGHRSPASAAELQAICDRLRVDPAWLLGLTDVQRHWPP